MDFSVCLGSGFWRTNFEAPLSVYLNIAQSPKLSQKWGVNTVAIYLVSRISVLHSNYSGFAAVNIFFIALTFVRIDLGAGIIFGGRQNTNSKITVNKSRNNSKIELLDV